MFLSRNHWSSKLIHGKVNINDLPRYKELTDAEKWNRGLGQLSFIIFEHVCPCPSIPSSAKLHADIACPSNSLSNISFRPNLWKVKSRYDFSSLF